MFLKDFVCNKCGECCRHLDKVPQLSHLQVGGVCKYLKDNVCMIYDRRPDLCRRDAVFDMCKACISEEEFVQYLTQLCQFYQDLKKQRDNEGIKNNE